MQKFYIEITQCVVLLLVVLK